MGTATKPENNVCTSVTLPTELRDAIDAKARYLSATFDQTLEVLLPSGLAAQNLRESEIEALAHRLASSHDSTETEQLGNQLGQTIFGHCNLSEAGKRFPQLSGAI